MSDKSAWGVAETGDYSTDSPNPHVDLSGSASTAFAISQVAGGILSDGDTFRCTVYKDASNWAIYSGATYTTGTPNIVDLSSATLVDSLGTLSDTDAVTVVGLEAETIVREVLEADRTYYVRADGNDSNDGLSNTSGGAFLTIQKAVDVVCNTIDSAGYQLTIKVGAGTYTGATTLRRTIGPLPPILEGDTTTPANVLISTTSSNCFTLSDKAAHWILRGFKLTTTTSGSGISCYFGRISISALDYGDCANYHNLIGSYGVVEASGGYTISGSASMHFAIIDCGVATINNRTVTLTGTPAFSTAWLYMRMLAAFSAQGATFSGSATGSRYNISLNSVVFTNGAGTSFLPGNSAGNSATGAQYA